MPNSKEQTDYKYKVKEEDAVSLKHVVSRRFAELREDRNISQSELANEIGTTQNLIFRIENGLKVSNESMFLVFLWYHRNFNVNADWLYSLDNSTLSKYSSNSDLQKRKLYSMKDRRFEIVQKMLDELKALEPTEKA